MPIPSINSKRCCPISHANNTPLKCGIYLLAGICKIGQNENGCFTVEIVNDDVGVERIHRLLHPRRQLAVRLVPALLDRP
jgi:hypothetical protein